MDRPKITARRCLTDVPVHVPEGWQLRSLAEVGEGEFSERMLAASAGDPYDTSTPESALGDLRHLVEFAGEASDPHGWFLVADDQGEVGVVLPQPFADDPERGTIFYLGVVPSVAASASASPCTDLVWAVWLGVEWWTTSGPPT